MSAERFFELVADMFQFVVEYESSIGIDYLFSAADPISPPHQGDIIVNRVRLCKCYNWYSFQIALNDGHNHERCRLLSQRLYGLNFDALSCYAMCNVVHLG